MSTCEGMMMGYDRWHAVRCQSCGLTLGESDRRFRSKAEAGKAWNAQTKQGASRTAKLRQNQDTAGTDPTTAPIRNRGAARMNVKYRKDWVTTTESQWAVYLTTGRRPDTI